MDISDITASDLQDEILARNIIQGCREQFTKRMEDSGYINLLAGYTSSVFQDFESYPRTKVDLVENDIRLVLDKNNSNIITYEFEPGIYNFRDPSESVFNISNLNVQHLET